MMSKIMIDMKLVNKNINEFICLSILTFCSFNSPTWSTCVLDSVLVKGWRPVKTVQTCAPQVCSPGGGAGNSNHLCFQTNIQTKEAGLKALKESDSLPGVIPAWEGPGGCP